MQSLWKCVIVIKVIKLIKKYYLKLIYITILEYKINIDTILNTWIKMTTIPQTTMAGATAPTGLGATPMVSDSCQVTVPDYSVLRQQNIKKINEYYNTLLSS